MQSINSNQISAMDKVYRLNLINSITGFKSANLIGSVDTDGNENLAVFSSITHLGSNPALVGLVLRPTTVPRHTYENILNTGCYTVNAVTNELKARAHFTSAKFDKVQSEFDKCALTAEYHKGFAAPFVKESPIQLGLSLEEDIEIKTNNTRLLVGKIQVINIDGNAIHPNGMVDLASLNVQTISGLNRYHSPDTGAIFPYARTNEVPEFETKEKQEFAHAELV